MSGYQNHNSRELERQIDELLKRVNTYRDEPESIEAQEENARAKKRYRRTLISTVVSLVTVIVAAVAISAVFMPVIRVSGGSMDPVYQDGDILVLWSGKSYSGGDLCCVSWHNKLLVKRIIGTAGDTIDIDGDGNVYVNGAALDEPYVTNKSLGECNIEFPLEVPEGQIFIMGDRRDTSIDSRHSTVGCVGEETILGRVMFRVWPL